MYFSRKWRQQFLGVALFLTLVVEVPIVTVGQLAKPEPADVMIILGSRVIGQEPGTMLRLRLDEAVRLYRAGFAPAIIVSGAKGEDEEVAEALAMRAYLEKHGVPGESILTEDGSFNTYQNLANSQAIMDKSGFRKALIVTNTSHIRRTLLLARDLGMEAAAAPAPMPENLYLVLRQYVREGAAMISLAFSR